MSVTYMLEYCKNKLNAINSVIESCEEITSDLMGTHTYYRAYIRRLQRNDVCYGVDYTATGPLNYSPDITVTVSGWL